MKSLVNVLLALCLIGAGAAAILFVILIGDEKEQNAAPKAPEKEPIVYMSTDGVAINIEKRLESRIGVQLDARCPKKVNEEIGTTFRCSIRRDGRPERIAIANVVIDGAGGLFSWTSKPVPRATATPSLADRS